MDRKATATAHPALAPPAIILARGDVAAIMTAGDYLASAREAFLALGSGRAHSPLPLHLVAEGGAIHAKGALMRLPDGEAYAAVKVNANFPGNPKQRGLPTIQGAIVLSDARKGCLLAIIDSIEVTLRRTAAASVLAARHLARPESAVLALCGCGSQARAQLAAFADAFALRRVYAWDADPEAARRLAEAASGNGRFPIEAVASLAEATAASDMIVTCTTARAPFLGPGLVRPGSFIAAIGADSAEKCELEPSLMAGATVVVDGLEQCAQSGDLHHAIAAGTMTAGGVHATLAEVVGGSKPGRRDAEEITVFDSTGMAVLDVAAAIRIHERARANGAGLACRLGE